MPLTREKIKRIVELHEAAGRDAQGLMLLEGPRLVAEGLRAGAVSRLIVADGFDPRALCAAARDVPVETVSVADLARIADVRTPAGVVALARLNRPQAVAPLFARSRRLLFLERVQDPGNAGTLARTAWALGVDALILAPGAADVASPKALRAAAGATITMPWARGVAAGEVLELAAASGHSVIVADAHEGADYRTIGGFDRFVLVASNEGAGTEIPLRDPRVVPVRIPLARGAESLNVGAAVAILLSRLCV